MIFAFHQRGSKKGGKDNDFFEDRQVRLEAASIVGKLSSNTGEHRYFGNAGRLSSKM